MGLTDRKASDLPDGIINLVRQIKQPGVLFFEAAPPLISARTKGLVINYGEGGATKWENRGSETFCATPSRQGKTFRAPPLKDWKLYAPPLQYG